MLIDTHCHLNLREAFPNPGEAVEEAVRAGVGNLIVIGIDLPSSHYALELADSFDAVYAAVGVHPNSASEYVRGDLREIEAMLSHPKALALGEIGLDFHWDFSTPDEQERALRDQLDLADQLQKPVVLHCREAYPDLLNVLEGRKRGRWLFHCFSGNEEEAERATKLDCYFGVDGPITYPKANDLRQVVRKLPKDRLLIETDAPYLTPAPFRGRPNRPAYVKFVNSGLASCLGMEEEASAALTTANACRLFGLLES